MIWTICEDTTMRDDIDEFYGRLTEDGNVAILYATDGLAVTSIDANVYPIGSNLSARYEHAEGIILSIADTKKLGIKIEDYAS